MSFESKVFLRGGIGTVIKSNTLRAWVLGYAKDLNIKFISDSGDVNVGDAVVWYKNGLITQSSTFDKYSFTLISNDEFIEKLDAFAEEIRPKTFCQATNSTFKEILKIDLDFYNEKIMFAEPLSEINFYTFDALAKTKEMGNLIYDKVYGSPFKKL